MAWNVSGLMVGSSRNSTSPGRGPLLGLAPVDLPNYPERWAESCIRFNDSVLAYVARTESIRLVIVASPFSAYLPAKDARRGQNRVLDRRGSVLAVNDPGASLAIDAMSDTIESLRRAGARD